MIDKGGAPQLVLDADGVWRRTRKPCLRLRVFALRGARPASEHIGGGRHTMSRLIHRASGRYNLLIPLETVVGAPTNQGCRPKQRGEKATALFPVEDGAFLFERPFSS